MAEPAGGKAPPVEIKAVFDLKPEAAITFLEAKGLRSTVAWSEMMHEEHSADFTVAKVAKLDLLADMKAAILKAQTDGTPFEQFQADIKPTLVKAGWWGLVTDETITGTGDPVFIGPRRLRTFYDTNMRMSRASGQWARIQAIKAKRPFLRYSAVMDHRTRPQHAAWHGLILPVDHPFWLTHFPPNGWNCRCTVQQLSQRDLDHRGWKVTADSAIPDFSATRPFYRKGAATPIFVPRGVDPGFAYNPGISRVDAAAGKAAQSMIDAHAAGDGDAAAAVLDELLGDAAPTKLPDSAVPALLKLIQAGDRDGLAKMLAALLGIDVATAALQMEATTASSRRKRQRKHGTSSSGHHGGRVDQDREDNGRFKFEGQHGPALGHTRDALTHPQRQRHHDLGPVNASAVARISTGTGRDVAGYRWHSTDDQFRHAYLDHQNADKEAKHGQRVLKLGDFERLHQVIAKPDVVIWSDRKFRGEPAIELRRQIDGETYHVIAGIMDRKAQVRFATLYVKVGK